MLKDWIKEPRNITEKEEEIKKLEDAILEIIRVTSSKITFNIDVFS